MIEIHHLDKVLFEKSEQELIKMHFDTPQAQGLHALIPMEINRRQMDLSRQQLNLGCQQLGYAIKQSKFTNIIAILALIVAILNSNIILHIVHIVGIQ